MNIDESSNEIPLTFHDNIIDAQILSKKILNYTILILIVFFLINFILIITVHKFFLIVFNIINFLIIITLLVYILLFAPIKGIFLFNIESKNIEYSIEYYFRNKSIIKFVMDDIEKFQLTINFDCVLSYDLFMIYYEGKKIKILRGYASRFENGYEKPCLKSLEKNLNEKLKINSYKNF